MDIFSGPEDIDNYVAQREHDDWINTSDQWEQKGVEGFSGKLPRQLGKKRGKMPQSAPKPVVSINLTATELLLYIILIILIAIMIMLYGKINSVEKQLWTMYSMGKNA